MYGNYQGVPSQIEQLYREHRAGLVRLVERELHDHHDAEDVVQTAFLDAQRALERGTTPRHPRAWLTAIAINAGRRLRRRRVIAEPLEEYAVQEASAVPEIRAALASLPREQREAVLYRDLLGLSYDETAEEMGKSVNAVTMLLHRGRKGLRQTLGVTTGGIWLGRWLKRAGMPQVAVAKGAAAVVVAGGLATTGVVIAQVIAPIGTEAAAAAPAKPLLGGLTMGAKLAPGGVLMLQSGSRRFTTGGDSIVTAVTPGFRTDDATPAGTSSPAGTNSSSPLTVGVATVSAPAVPPTPTSPVTVAATVTTPITTVAVTTPTGTTATVTTPITTVTVPIP